MADSLGCIAGEDIWEGWALVSLLEEAWVRGRKMLLQFLNMLNVNRLRAGLENVVLILAARHR
jgi:hypothetical protein